MPENNELSDREKEILRLVATGASNKKIARELVISVNTVKVHLRNIFSKLEVSSRTEATLFALRAGIVQPHGEEAGVLDGSESAQEPLSAAETLEGVAQVTERPKRWWQRPWMVALAGALTLALLVLLIVVGLNWRRWQVPAPTTAFSAQVVNPDRWEARAEMKTPRKGFAAVPYEGLVYTIGGETISGVTGTVEVYDPISDTWKTAPDKPTPATDLKGALVGGLIYVPGGRLSDGRIGDIFEVYDPLKEVWSVRTALPKPLSAYALVAFEGRLYLFGGWDGHTYTNFVYEYDPALDRWQERTSMPTARGYAGATVAGGVIYVIGGTDGETSLDVNEAYWPARENTQEEPWSSFPPLPAPRYDMGVVSTADIIHVVGGESHSGESLPSLKYFPQKQQWGSFEVPGNGNWQDFGITSIGSWIYAMGGSLGGEISGKNMAYQALFTVWVPVVR
jgi:DNA-binding CsgD family transcriptional regulator